LITSSKHILASSNPAISGTGRDSSSFHTDYKGLQMDKTNQIFGSKDLNASCLRVSAQRIQ